MQINLRPPTVQRIRTALGDDVDLSPAAVPEILARLAVESPDVYSQVLAEISGSEVRLDSERELQRRRRRSVLRRALFGWGEYESEVGDRLIAKRNVAAAVPLGMAGLILALLLVSNAVGHRHSPLADRAAAPRATPGVPVHAAGRPSRPAPAAPRARPVPAHVRPVDLMSDAPGALPPAPSWTLAAATPLAIPAPPDPANPRTGPLLNPIVFTRQPIRVRVDGAEAAQSDVAAGSPIVYDRAESAGPGGPARGGGGSDEASSQASSPAGAGVPPLGLRSSVDLRAAVTPSGRRWIPGQRVPARLATGVVVVAGGPPVPVVAESPDPPITWLGHAVLGSEGLVQMTFVPAASGDWGGARGVALAPDRLVPGLAGRTAVRHPRAAGAAISAALQAAADYAQALARQGQVVLLDGWAQVTSGLPGQAWTYLAARLAQGFDLQGHTEGPIETAEIDAGAALVILVTEAP